jgi:hypothetical protein
MKKLALFFALLAICGFVLGACSSDDGNGGGNAKQCIEACSAAADCVQTGTTEEDWKCQSSRCVFDMCSTDTDCTALFSGWTTECTDGGNECTQGYACISVGGGGLCAFEPIPGTVECTTMQMEEIQMPAIDGSGDVAVCGNTDYSCEGNLCVAPGCADDTECAAPYPYCVSGTCVQCKADADCTAGMTKCTSFGMCGCADDTECTGAMTKCTSVGMCGCVDDTECAQATADKCYDGFCGCSSAEVCTGQTAGANTTWVCEKQ